MILIVLSYFVVQTLCNIKGIVHAKIKILLVLTHYLQQTSVLFHGTLKESCYREEMLAQVLLNFTFVFILYCCCHEHLKNNQVKKCSFP